MRHDHIGQEATQPRQALSLGEDKPVRLLPSQEEKEKSLAQREEVLQHPFVTPSHPTLPFRL